MAQTWAPLGAWLLSIRITSLCPAYLGVLVLWLSRLVIVTAYQQGEMMLHKMVSIMDLRIL